MSLTFDRFRVTLLPSRCHRTFNSWCRRQKESLSIVDCCGHTHRRKDIQKSRVYTEAWLLFCQLLFKRVGPPLVMKSTSSRLRTPTLTTVCGVGRHGLLLRARNTHTHTQSAFFFVLLFGWTEALFRFSPPLGPKYERNKGTLPLPSISAQCIRLKEIIIRFVLSWFQSEMRKMKRRHLVGGGMEGADGLTDQYAHY